MNILGSMLRLLSEDVTFFVDGFTLLLSTLASWNFWMVSTFLKHAAGAGQALVAVASGVGRTLEDLASFVRDLLDIAVGLLDAAEAFSLAAWYSASAALRWTGQLVVGCAWWLAEAVSWLAHGALAAAHLTGRALALLWVTLLTTLGLLPRSISLFGSSVNDLVVCVAHKLSRGGKAARETFRGFLLFLGSTPRDAYLGLVILSVSWYLFKRFDLLRRFRTTAVQIPDRFMRLGSALAALTKRLALSTSAMLRNAGSMLTRATAAEEADRETPPPAEEEAEEPTPDARSTRVLRSATRSPASRSPACGGGEEDVVRLRKQVERLQDMNLCVVCQEDARSFTLLPCRHLCLCRKCTERVLEDRPVCPMCRKQVHEVLRVYT